MSGFYHEGQWIPSSGGPEYSRCPVCGKYHRWADNRTCLKCPGVLLLAIYSGDYLEEKARSLDKIGLI